MEKEMPMPVTIIVEDGTMPEGANSFASVADADAYLVPRGLWEETPSDDDGTVADKKAAALLRATDYMNTLLWYGETTEPLRVMCWPRKDVRLSPAIVVDDDTVPPQVKMACMELAGLIYTGTNPMKVQERGGKIIAESHSLKKGDVDVIGGDSTSDSYTYAEAAPVEDYLPSVMGLLRPFLLEIPGKSRSFGTALAVMG